MVTRAGLAAPRFLGGVEIDGRPGLVFERVDGPSMLDVLVRKPWSYGRLAAEFALLHASVHAARAVELPRLKENIGNAIERATPALGPERAAAALDRLDQMSDGTALCHMDFHPGNVVTTSSGPVVIDWMSAALGPPEADVARTAFLIALSAVPRDTPRRLRALASVVRGPFATRYLLAYVKIRPLDIQQLDSWMLPVMAARLAEGIEDETAPLLARIDRELQQVRAR